MEIRASQETGATFSSDPSVGVRDRGVSRDAPGDRCPRILVADDDTAIRELLTVAFEMEGYQVLAARDGAEALDVVESFAPDMIVLDMQMPLMGGRDFADAYHGRLGPHAPIIALTASRDPKTSAEEVGAYAYMPKPFELNELLAIAAQITRNEPRALPAAG